MNSPFENNLDYEEMRDVVRAFCLEQAGEPVVRRIMETAGGFDRPLWQRLGQELGALGLMIPEALGGSAQGVAAQAMIFEEFGAALMTGPVMGTLALAIPALMAASPGGLRDRHLSALATGEAVAAFAVPDVRGRFVPAVVRIEAVQAGDDWRLHGDLAHVVDAPYADLLIVAAHAGDRLGLWLVEKDEPGLSIEAMPVMDLTRRRGLVRLDGCRGMLLVEGPDAVSACARAFLVAGALLAAEQAGAAGRVLDFTVDYVANRVQFGRPIASFQAIKHRCADLLVAVEHARSVSRYAAWAIDQDDAAADVHVAVARSICSEAFHQLATASIQLHGGIGFTWEHPAHLYLKRAVGDAALLGSATEQREIIAAGF